MRLLTLPDVLRAEGLTVVEYDGWKTRGSSTFTPRGLVAHSTAGTLDPEDDHRVLWVTGSNTAPAPISQLHLDRDGVWTVGASGRCNHVKVGTAGRWKGYGNTSLIGVEAANDNNGEPWPAAQHLAYIFGVAALFRHMGWTARELVGHLEHQPGEKTDPYGLDMEDFRSDLAYLLETGMTLKQLVDMINTTNGRVYALTQGTPTVEWGIAKGEPVALVAKVDDLATRVAKLQDGGVDLDAVADALLAKVAAKLGA